MTGFDPADEGIRQAKAEAARLGLRISAEVNTFENFEFGPDWSARGVDERLVRLLAERPPAKPDGCIWNGQPVAVGDSACWEESLLRCRVDGWQFTREKCSP
ncbi:MAG: hypothetical protein ABI693_08430 [Bryobacteraceae bacterium]